jgi:hypothetical protein
MRLPRGLLSAGSLTAFLPELNPWYALDVLSPAFRAIDRAVPGAAAHVALDVAVSRLRARSVFHPHAFYPNGFGDTSVLPAMAEELLAIQAVGAGAGAGDAGAGAQTAARPPRVVIPDIAVTLAPSSHGRAFATVQEGEFAAPAYTAHLPPESHVARFQLVTPTAWASGGGCAGATPPSSSYAEDAVRDEMCAHRPIVVLLAGTGEQGFRRRRHCVSYPLARLGVATLVLEGAYYGSRRPPTQRGSKLATLVDLPVLGRATIEEARCLVKWLRGRTGVPGKTAAAAVAAEEAAAAAAPRSAAQHRIQSPLARIRSALGGPGNDTGVQHISESAVAAAAGRRGSGGGGGGGPGDAPPAPAHQQAPPPSPTGGYGSVVLAGTSMGGLHAAMAAATLPWPVGVASWLGPPSAAAVFTRGALALGTDWAGLAADTADGAPAATALDANLAALEAVLSRAPPGPRSPLPADADADALAAAAPAVPRAALAAAQRQAARLLRLTDLTNFSPPVRPDAAVFVTATHDQYVPWDAGAEALWGGVRGAWRGCDVRKVRGGHVSASLFALDTYAGTIVEVIRRLRAASGGSGAGGAGE